jgi:hypothetical protein
MWLLLANFVQRFLFAGTVCAVWIKCRHTLRASRYTSSTFFRDCWLELNEAIQLMDNRNYKEITLAATASGAE